MQAAKDWVTLSGKLKLEQMRGLLEIPAVKESINARNKKGETAFFLAAERGRLEYMQMLAEAGADPVLLNPSSGRTLLIRFTEEYKNRKIKNLLEIPAVREHINARLSDGVNKGESAFSLLLKAKSPRADEVIDLFLEAGADSNLPDDKKNTLLMRLVLEGWLLPVKRLLEIPAVKESINIRNQEGRPALSVLASSLSRFNKEIPELLVKAGADANLKDEEGNTLLMREIIQEDGSNALLDTVRNFLTILTVREQINTTNKSGDTAFFLALKYRRFFVTGYLLEAGADPVQTDEQGNTILMKAVLPSHWLPLNTILAGLGYDKMTEILLDIPAVKESINAQNNKGETPLSLAKTVKDDFYSGNLKKYLNSDNENTTVSSSSINHLNS